MERWDQIVVDGIRIVDSYSKLREEERRYGYVHGWLSDKKEGPPQHHIIEYWCELPSGQTNWRPLASCTSFEAALAAGSLMTGACMEGLSR